jgi:hypothetical protein
MELFVRIFRVAILAGCRISKSRRATLHWGGAQWAAGFLPPLDDEYPELLAVLRSVARARGRPYVIVEVPVPCQDRNWSCSARTGIGAVLSGSRSAGGPARRRRAPLRPPRSRVAAGRGVRHVGGAGGGGGAAALSGRERALRGRRASAAPLPAGAPPLPRTKWTRRVPHPVLIGHAASLTPY